MASAPLAKQNFQAAVEKRLDDNVQGTILSVSVTLTLLFVLATSHLFPAARSIRIPSTFYVISFSVIIIGIGYFLIIRNTLESTLRLLGLDTHISVDQLLGPLTSIGNVKVARLVVVFLALTEFLSLGYLTNSTGGIVNSPYFTILISYFALAPYIMRGVESIFWLWYTGSAYIVILVYGQPFLVRPVVPPSTSLYAEVAVGTLAISMLIALLLAWAQRIRERRNI